MPGVHDHDALAVSATTPSRCVISITDMANSVEIGEQLEDLRLDRDVERRRGLVGDHELRTAAERHRDHHALAHAAGELMRIIDDTALRMRNANEPSISIARASAARRPTRSCDADHLRNLFANR